MEKYETRRPDARVAAEPGQNKFYDERLDLEQQKGSRKNCQAKDPRWASKSTHVARFAPLAATKLKLGMALAKA